MSSQSSSNNRPEMLSIFYMSSIHKRKQLFIAFVGFLYHWIFAYFLMKIWKSVSGLYCIFVVAGVSRFQGMVRFRRKGVSQAQAKPTSSRIPDCARITAWAGRSGCLGGWRWRTQGNTTRRTRRSRALLAKRPGQELAMGKAIISPGRPWPRVAEC